MVWTAPADSGEGPGVQQSRPNLKHGFAAQGSSDWGQGRLNTDYYTKPSIWHCSLLGIHPTCCKGIN